MVADRKKPLIPYLRQSVKKERTISIEDQRRDIQRWAEREGVQLAAEIVEGQDKETGRRRNASGAKSWRQRELGAGIEACQRGEASGIIVAYQSRLSRENGLGTAEVYKALEDAGARLVCVAENIDTWGRGDPADTEMFFSFQAAIARREWRRAQGYFAKGKHQAWEAGIFTGTIPAGYEAVYDPVMKNRNDKPLMIGMRKASWMDNVLEAIRLKQAGATPTEVGRFLTARGVPTWTGNREWGYEAAKVAFRSPVYFGLHRCPCGCGEEVIREDWAVVSKATWRAVAPPEIVRSDAPPRYKLKYSPQRGIDQEENPEWRAWLDARPGTDEPHAPRGEALLSGFMTCAGCGKKRVHRTSTTQNGTRYEQYRCNNRTGCDSKCYAPVPALDSFVVDAALTHLGTVQGYSSADKDFTALERRVEDARAAVEELREMMGVEPPASAKQVLELQAAEIALENADPGGKLVVLLGPEGVDEGFGWQTREAFDAMSRTAQRALLRQLVLDVKVGRGRVPLWQKVEVTLADGTIWEPPVEITNPQPLLAIFDNGKKAA
jgi:Resolvase, N terminal domain/Recombinase zinc beta ribbon domain